MKTKNFINFLKILRKNSNFLQIIKHDKYSLNDVDLLIDDLTNEKFNNLFYFPLIYGLKTNDNQIIKNDIMIIIFLIEENKLNIKNRDTDNSVLYDICLCLLDIPARIVDSLSTEISQLVLSIINSERSPNSPIHGKVLVDLVLIVIKSISSKPDIFKKHMDDISISHHIISILSMRYSDPTSVFCEPEEISHVLISSAMQKSVSNLLIRSELNYYFNTQVDPPDFLSVYQLDIVLLIEEICKYGMELSDSVENADFQILGSLFSYLSFILSDITVLGLKIVHLLKNNVYRLILTHSLTKVPELFKMILMLASTLFTLSYAFLKPEVSSLMSILYFRILDGEFPIKLKEIVSESIKNFQPSFLSQLFVNFDCDTDVQKGDLFVHLVDSLIKNSNNQLVLSALESILTSLENWNNNDITYNNRLTKYENKRKLKVLYSEAIEKFNSDPESGFKELIATGLVKDDPKEIASFFHTHKNLLNPAGVGMILGGDPHKKETCKDIINCYLDQINFQYMSICDAIYHFLSLFKLPGESQQIDRILERFAHRYYFSNQASTEFKNAEAVFDLSFAIVILHTDAHNPYVKNKMKLNQFIKMFRDLEDGSTLDDAYLKKIFDYVVNNEISLLSSANVIEIKSPQDVADELLRDNMNNINEAHKMNKSIKNIYWIRNIKPEILRSMFDAVYEELHSFCLKAIKNNFMNFNIDLILNIIASSISISDRFCLKNESESNITLLCELCYIDSKHGVNLVNVKSMAKFIELLSIIRPSYSSVWHMILKCFSYINDILLQVDLRDMRNLTYDDAKVIGEYIQRSDLFSVFDKTSEFNPNQIVSFISAICDVCEYEIELPEPRLFCLHKLVEITILNMNRERFVWTKMWKPIGNLLSKAGLNKNELVARTALDSLRQLAGRFFRIEELKSFNYQRALLSPINSILSNSSNSSVRNYAVQCIKYIVLQYSSKMYSGWESFFNMLNITIDMEDVGSTSASLILEVVEKHFTDIVSDNFLDDLLDIIVRYINKDNMISTIATTSLIRAIQISLIKGLDESIITSVYNSLCRIVVSQKSVCLILRQILPYITNWKLAANQLYIPLWEKLVITDELKEIQALTLEYNRSEDLVIFWNGINKA